MRVVAELVDVPGRIAICEGGESAIFRLGAHDDVSRNPCVPHRSIRLLVRFFILSKSGLAVNIVMVTVCDQQVVKGTISPRIATMNDVVERGVGILSEMLSRDKQFKNSSRTCRFVFPTVRGGSPIDW